MSMNTRRKFVLLFLGASFLFSCLYGAYCQIVAGTIDVASQPNAQTALSDVGNVSTVPGALMTTDEFQKGVRAYIPSLANEPFVGLRGMAFTRCNQYASGGTTIMIVEYFADRLSIPINEAMFFVKYSVYTFCPKYSIAIQY